MTKTSTVPVSASPSPIRPARRAGLGLLAAALLAACADPSGIAGQSAYTDASALAAQRTLTEARAATAAWPTEGWWRAWNDPGLDRLIGDALSDNPNLKLAEARLRNAQALAGLADANRGPRLDAGATLSRERLPEGYIYPAPLGGSTQTDARLGLSFSWELDLWGRRQAEAAAALDRASAAEVEAQAARLMLAVAIARGWNDLDGRYAQHDVAAAEVEQRRQVLELTRQRVAAGLDSSVELKQAEGAVPAARQQLAATEEGIRLARTQLAALAGRGPDFGLALPRPALRAPEALALPSTIPAELLGRRPDLIAARLRAEAAAKDSTAARAAFYPNVNLAAFAGFQALGLSHLVEAGNRSLSVTPAVTLPIFDSGRLRANLAASEAGGDIAIEQYNAALVDGLHEVADALASARSLETQQAEQRAAQASAEEALRLANLRYREGLSNYLTVLSAQTEVLAQRRLGATLRTRRNDVSLALVRALGGGYQPAAGVATASTAAGPRPVTNPSTRS
ncbi:efflux transporter outer membrane subunit [Plasticicumulans sp.]|uniref:efflux transporter outer membrane subunit n=1 Tax=Plasticicumulans sp. TaxID=2307179 RepID=UPI003929A8D9